MESDSVNKLNSIEETFESMDGVSQNRKYYTEMVEEFLKKKERRPYYLVSYYDNPETNNEVELLRPLTDENIAEINASLDDYIKKEYPEEVENNGLLDADWRADIISEVIDEFRDKEYLCNTNQNGDYMEIIDIDICTKYYCYRIKVAIFPNGMANPPEFIDMKINLPDDVYSYLLVEFMLNSELSFNKLRTKNEEVYGKISSYVDRFFHNCTYPLNVPTYAVEFTEIIEDAQTLLNSIGSKN